MKKPYLGAEMDIHFFDSYDIINCSDSADQDAIGDRGPSINDDIGVTTADPSATTTEWVPTCNQGKPDPNAWG